MLNRSSRCSTADSARVTFRNLKKKYGMQSGDGSGDVSKASPKKPKASPKKGGKADNDLSATKNKTSPKKRKIKEESEEVEMVEDDDDAVKVAEEEEAYEVDYMRQEIIYDSRADLDLDGNPLEQE